MSKKNNRKSQPHSMLRSLKDLGQEGRQTLSRLATTVKTDAPVMLGKAGKGAEIAKPSGMQRFAQGLNPFSAQRRVDRQAQKKLKKIAKQMAGGQAMTSRRLRLPVVPLIFAMILALVGGTGYYAYSHFKMPSMKLSHYVDYKTWLNVVSGNAQPDRTHKKSMQTVALAKATAKLPSQKNAPKAKLAIKVSKKDKGFVKLSRAEKKKVWKAKLAKLKKQSDAKYQTVSHRIR